METVIGIIVGLLIITFLVVVHELGHALVARRNGVIVEEFGIGFPPRIWGRKAKKSPLGNNVLFSINLLPLGGFVKLQGEHDSDKKKGDYGAASFWQKTNILLAGVAMNWAVAVVLFTILAAIGIPKIIPNQFSIPADTTVLNQPVEIVSVGKESPAEKAGLRSGDKILRFADAPLEQKSALATLAEQHKGEKVSVVYSRGGTEYTTSATLRADNADKKGYLGVTSAQQELVRSTWSAPVVGVGLTAQLSWVTLQGVGDLLVKAVTNIALQLSPDEKTRQDASQTLSSIGDGVAGPVGIYGVIFPAAEKAGFVHLVLLSAIISLTLAVMNILPIPALDGGRWFVTWLYRLRKKVLTQEIEEKIHGIGFMVLMALVVLVTIADIGKLRG